MTLPLSRQEPSEWRHWARPAAVALVIAQKPAPSLLLTRRAFVLQEHAGQIACPGGGFDAEQDVSLRDTARRETWEELSLALPNAAFMGVLRPVFIPASGYTVLPFVAMVSGQPPLVMARREVAGAAWLPLAWLYRHRWQRLARYGSGARLGPVFVSPWGTIWGATARMVDDLLERLGRGWP